MVSKKTQALINRDGDLDVVNIKKRLDARREKMYGRPAEFKKKKSFAPSNLGFVGQCPRHWYYAFNGAVYGSKFVPAYAAAATAGIDRHTRIQKEYKEEFDAEIEGKISHSDPELFGFSDVIANFDGVIAVGDIKSVKNDKFAYMANTLAPDMGNALQVYIYMYVRNIDNGFLHYENRDTLEELFFPLKMTDKVREYVERALGWMRTVKDNAENGVLPERGFDAKSWQCKFCPVAKKCWSDDKDLDGEIKLPNFVLEKH